MIIYFTQEDMLSFGNYLLSSVRGKVIRENLDEGLSEKEIENILSMAHPIGLDKWNTILHNMKEQSENQTKNEQ